MPVTKTQQAVRLNAIRDRRNEARDRVIRARQAVAAAQQVQDKQAEQVAEGALTDSWQEVEVCQGLELALLSQMSGVGRDAGQGLLNNLDAHRALQEIASSSAPLRANVHVGDFMTLDETIGLTGRMLAALTVPDGGGATGFIGPIVPPAPPTSLLDFFSSVPFQTRTADLMRRSGVADAAIQVAGAIKNEADLVYTGQRPRADRRVVGEGQPAGPRRHRGAAGRHPRGAALRRVGRG